MIATVSVDYKDSKVVKILLINEVTGITTPYYVDLKDREDLAKIYDLLESGVTYADFNIKKHEDGTFSLTHGDECYEAGEITRRYSHNVDFTDPPSFVGFVRQMINVNGFYLVREEPGVTEVHKHNVVACRTTKFNKYSELSVSHIVPGFKEGKWRWTSTSIMKLDNKGDYNDYSEQLFLCPFDADLGAYTDLVTEHSPVVVKEYGEEYRCVSLNSGLDVFVNKSRILLTPAIISRLHLIADTYKASLTTLTQGLFEELPMEYNTSKSYPPDYNPNKYVFLVVTHKVDKQLSQTMFDFLVKDKQGKLNDADLKLLNKSYPLYKGYKSIVSSQFGIFQSEKVPHKNKMMAYDALSKNECLVRLLLAECLHTAMHGDEFLVRYWLLNNNFDSMLNNYFTAIRGGGEGAKIFTDS